MSSTRKRHSVIFLFLSCVCIVAFLAGIVGGALIAAGGIHLYRIPSNSMSPTISTGDSFIVERITYCFSQPKRGDIVAISTDELPVPYDKKELFCQRIIGVPGDLLEVKFGRIHVNGCPLSECKPPVAPVDRFNPLAVTSPNIWLRMAISSSYRKKSTFLSAITSAIRWTAVYLGPSSRKSILGKVAFTLHSGH